MLAIVSLEVISSVLLKFDRSITQELSEVDKIARAYPGEDLSTVRQMLHESWQELTFDYAPFVEFRVQPFSGDHVTVYEPGYRNDDQLNWPSPEKSAFLFGGSTTFGIGVSNEHTITHYLSKRIPDRAIYNFGVPAYFSTQERIAFFNLVTQGFKPAIAIFIDGLNDLMFFDVPDRSNFSNRLQTAGNLNYGYMFRKIISRSNMVQLGLALLSERPDLLLKQHVGEKEEVGKAAHRLIHNREIIDAYCRSADILCLFVTQPIPTLENRISTTSLEAYPALQNCIPGYRILKNHYSNNPMPTHLDLSELTSQMPMYVDLIHYSRHMNEQIARAVASRLEELDDMRR